MQVLRLPVGSTSYIVQISHLSVRKDLNDDVGKSMI